MGNQLDRISTPGRCILLDVGGNLIGIIAVAGNATLTRRVHPLRFIIAAAALSCKVRFAGWQIAMGLVHRVRTRHYCPQVVSRSDPRIVVRHAIQSAASCFSAVPSSRMNFVQAVPPD